MKAIFGACGSNRAKDCVIARELSTVHVPLRMATSVCLVALTDGKKNCFWLEKIKGEEEFDACCCPFAMIVASSSSSNGLIPLTAPCKLLLPAWLSCSLCCCPGGETCD